VHVELHGKVQYKAFEINACRLERQAQEALNRAEIVGRWKDRRTKAVFLFAPIMLRCMSPLLDKSGQWLAVAWNASLANNPFEAYRSNAVLI